MAQDAPRDERVAARVELIAEKPDFPAFSHQIEDTLRVLGDEAVSVQQLAELVLRNYGLTLEVLRAANSFTVNRAGVPIFSVAQAISGWASIGCARYVEGGRRKEVRSTKYEVRSSEATRPKTED